MAKPVRVSDWATSGTALKTDPGVSKQAEGWSVEAPAVQYFNWWMNIVGQWISYLDIQMDAVVAQKLNYDAVVGVDGTHSTINDAVAAVSEGAKILVVDPLALTATQIVNKNDILIEFKPTALVSTVTGLALGLQIDAERVRVIGGRFTAFNNGGDKAMQFTAACKNCLLTQVYFYDNDTDVDDLGKNTVMSANINEVV